MDTPSVADAVVRHCTVCGCSDVDCSGCIQRTGAPCFWVLDQLCSACATLEQILERSLEMVRAGASLSALGPLVAAQAQQVLGASGRVVALSAGDSDDDAGLLASWDTVRREVRRVGVYGTPQLSAEVMAVVRAAGGWREMCGVYETAAWHSFAAAYRSSSDASRQMCLHGNLHPVGPSPICSRAMLTTDCHPVPSHATRPEPLHAAYVAPGVLFRCPACRTPNPECYHCGELALAREVVSVRYGRAMSHRHICDSCARQAHAVTAPPAHTPAPIPQWAVDIAVELDATDDITPDDGVGLAFGASLLKTPPSASATQLRFVPFRQEREAVWDKIHAWGVVTGGGQSRGSLIAVAGVNRTLTDLVTAARRECFCTTSAAQLAQVVGEPGLEVEPELLAARLVERINILEACKMPDAPELRELVRLAAALSPEVVSALRGVAAALAQELERTYPPEEDTIRGAFRTLGTAIANWMVRRAIDATIAWHVDDPPYISQTLSFAGIRVAVEAIATSWSTDQRRAALGWAIIGSFADPPEPPPPFLEVYA